MAPSARSEPASSSGGPENHANATDSANRATATSTQQQATSIPSIKPPYVVIRADMSAFDTSSPNYDPAKLPGSLGIVELGNGTASSSSQEPTASGSAMKLGPNMFPEGNTCIEMLYLGLHTSTFNATNQWLRKFVAMNATQLYLTTGIDVKRLLADKASDYTRPGLRWGDVLFLHHFPSGRRGLRFTLSVRVPGSHGAPSRLLNFASIDPQWLDRDVAKNMLLQALHADALPEFCQAVFHPGLGPALLASSAAQIDEHGRRYVVLRPKASIAHEPVFAYYIIPGSATNSDPSPVPKKKAYTFKQYQADIKGAMRRQWPVEPLLRCRLRVGMQSPERRGRVLSKG